MHRGLVRLGTPEIYRRLIRGALILLAAMGLLTLLGAQPELVAIAGLWGRATAAIAAALRLLTAPPRRWFSATGLVVAVGATLLAAGSIARLLGFAPPVPERGVPGPLPLAELLIVAAMALADRYAPFTDRKELD